MNVHRPEKGGFAMNKMHKAGLSLLFFFLLFHAGGNACLADDDCHHGDDSYQDDDSHHGDDSYHDDDSHHGDAHRHPENQSQHYLAPVTNPVYKETCGSCHFAYQPELLPAASWQAILNNTADHFGESLELDDDSRKGIADYLQANSAEKSGAKRAVKIMRSLGSQVPQRITDIPYIREKHHEISAQVFAQPSIGSQSNCSVCHKTAEQGIYDHDTVEIPR